MSTVANPRHESTRFSHSQPIGSAAVAATISRLVDLPADDARDRAELGAVAAGERQLEAALRTLHTWRAIGGGR